MGVETRNCVVVEDSTSGVRAAQNAGMKVIAFTGAAHFIPSLEQRLKDEKPDWFCSDIHELKCVLKQFEVQ